MVVMYIVYTCAYKAKSVVNYVRQKFLGRRKPQTRMARPTKHHTMEAPG